jgi:hypothetical protein
MRLLPAAKEASGGTTPDLGEGIDFEQVELDVRRHAQRNRLREALKIDDDKLIVAAALPDLYGSIDTLSPGEQVRVQRAIESVKQPRARTRT